MKHAIRQGTIAGRLRRGAARWLAVAAAGIGALRRRVRRRAEISDWLLRDAGIQHLTDDQLAEMGITRRGNGRGPGAGR